jgi:hypothetical protein
MTPQQLTDDLSAVQADDLLLDLLGSATPTESAVYADDELNAFLLAWRTEAETAPMPALVDVDTAVATITAATRTLWDINPAIKTAALLLLAVIAAVAITLTVIERGVS